MGNLRQSMTEEEWNAIGHKVEIISHPQHYGGKDNHYEAIKVIDAWGLDFTLGNVVKYIARAGKKNDNVLEDLRKASWYLDHAINKLS
jgi:hypothetical protein